MAGLSDVAHTAVDVSAEGYKNAGNECMRNQNYDAAIDNYKKGLTLDPKNPVLNCNLAQAYLNQKAFSEAEKFAKFAIEEQGTYVKGYYRAARAALGRHSVYDAMLYLANGISNCSSQGTEDLFAMARELSTEFETCLRKCCPAKAETQAPPTKPVSKAPSGTMFSGKIKSDGIAVKIEKKVEVKEEVNEDLERKLHEKCKKKKDLEKKQEELLQQKKEIKEELEKVEKETRELKEQEKREREKKAKEKRDKEKREQEQREKTERDKIQEKKELEAHRQKMQELQKKKAEEEKVQKEINFNMREGSLSLLKGLIRKATEHWEKVLHTFKSAENSDSENMDIAVLRFSYSQALIQGEYPEILKGMKVLDSLESEGMHFKFPGVFLLKGRALVRLNRFKEAEQPLNRGLLFLCRGTSFLTYSWPGTTEVIKVTERQYLKGALQSELQNCKVFHKPDAVCFYEKCLTTSQHIIPCKNIFFSDPDFIGFVMIMCQENCHIYFHLACWKDFKEHLSIEKLSEKDFLGRVCLTPDCKKKKYLEESACIVKVAIIGPDGEEKSKCECAPPLPTVLPSIEKTSTLSKSSIKRQRKKDMEKTNKHEHIKKKRTRCDSKSQVDFQTDKKNSQGNKQEYADALSKLIAARKQNFGYKNHTSSNVVHKIPPPHLKPDEEFIYSYFMEIFRTNGHMTIFQLQEHWEASRPLLPELKPAIVTHTDLVKFLLDTDGFAVVQDMIGIACDLPKISAVVESKCEPLPLVSGWQCSAATLQEASQTLSFKNYEEVDTKAVDFNKHDCDKSSSSSYHSVNEDFNKEEETNSIDVVGNSNASISYNHTLNHDEATCVNSYNSNGHENSGDSSDSYCSNNVYDQNPDLPLSVESSEAPTSNNLIFKHIKPVLPNLPSLPPETDVSVELGGMKSLEINNETNNNCKFSNLPVTNDQTMQSKEQSLSRAAWKPRAKLLEWACETFPGESKLKLWDALTKVRSENNFTLSGLSFNAIAERVRSALLIDNAEL